MSHRTRSTLMPLPRQREEEERLGRGAAQQKQQIQDRNLCFVVKLSALSALLSLPLCNKAIHEPRFRTLRQDSTDCMTRQA